MASVTRYRGRWRAYVRRTGHRPTSRVFDTKQEAQRWARDAELALERQARVPTDLRVTLADVIDAYTERAMRPTTSRSKRAALVAMRREIGHLRLAEILAPQLVAWATRRERAGAGPATLGMDLSFLGTALRHGAPLLSAGEAARPAIAAVDEARRTLAHAGRVRPPRRRDRRPTDEELRRLRLHLTTRPHAVIPVWDLALFAIATAMRLGEITRIVWEDVDFEKRTVVIRARKHPGAPRDSEVPLLTGPAVVLGAVVDPLALMLRQRSAEIRRGRVFPYAERSVGTAWTRAVAACAVPDLHFHDLRHDAVSRMFEFGYSIEQVGLVSGHTTWANLARYTQIKPETLHFSAGGRNFSVD